MWHWLKWSTGVGFAVVLSVIGFMWATYIDVLVESGSAYGFGIGDTKRQAYLKLQSEYSDQDMWMMHPVNEQGLGPFVSLGHGQPPYDSLVSRELWAVHFGKSHWNVLRLSFQGDRLVKIFRHRQYFEFP